MDSCIDKVENALLEILRREVTGEDGTEKMELSVAGLNAVMRLAREHAVTGLVANAAMRNRIVIAGGAAEGRGEIVMRLMQQTMAHRQNQRRFEDAVGRFARLMEENSIAYVEFRDWPWRDMIPKRLYGRWTTWTSMSRRRISCGRWR